MIPIITGSAKGVTDHIRSLGHAISLAVVGGMLFGMTVYTGYTAKRRTKKAKGSCWYKWGPTVLVGIASCLIIADTVRHVLQDQGFWAESNCRGFVGNFGSNQYICAPSTSHCCPSTDKVYGIATYTTIYHDVTNKTDPAHVDVPWNVVCDAGIGKIELETFLAQPCEASESWKGKKGLLHGAAWGCTVPKPQQVNTTWTNQDALIFLTNRTYLFGPGETDFVFQGPKGYFSNHLAGGCHSNESMSCLGGTGFLFTTLCTYIGFLVLMVGSLWNANFMDKMQKARDQWDELRGNTPRTAKPLVSSVSRASVGRGSGSVAEVATDAEFAALIDSGQTAIVKFTGSWCKPCKEIAPAFATLAAQNRGAKFVTVDVEECSDTAHNYDVSAMPTFIHFAGGRKVGEYSGANEANLSAFVRGAMSGTPATMDVEEGECKT